MQFFCSQLAPQYQINIVILPQNNVTYFVLNWLHNVTFWYQKQAVQEVKKTKLPKPKGPLYRAAIYRNITGNPQKQHQIGYN
jgi:hypothetical protein